MDETETEFDDESEDEFGGPLGQPGSMHNPDIHIKWVADGSETLADVSASLRSCADYMDRLQERGWQLSQPVGNSHGYVEWAGSGEAPAAECAIGDCPSHRDADVSLAPQYPPTKPR